MAMSVGQAHTDPVSGLAGRIWTALLAASDSGLSSPLTANQRNALAAMCEAIAAGVIAELQANATVTIHTTDAGLQTSAAAGVATTGPAANKTLPGGCIG